MTSTNFNPPQPKTTNHSHYAMAALKISIVTVCLAGLVAAAYFSGAQITTYHQNSFMKGCGVVACILTGSVAIYSIIGAIKGDMYKSTNQNKKDIVRFLAAVGAASLVAGFLIGTIYLRWATPISLWKFLLIDAAMLTTVAGVIGGGMLLSNRYKCLELN